MIKLPRIPGILACATLVTGFASPGAVAGPVAVPFLAVLTTTEKLSLNPAVCPTLPNLEGTTTGSGYATHLGAVTGIATDCITPTSAYTFTFTNGTVSLVAANGDELRATYSGYVMPSPVQPISSVSGTYRITGGTGRFSNASGLGVVLGLENLQTGQGQLTFEGTISY